MTAATATLTRFRLERTAVIRMLGSNAPMVLPAGYGERDRDKERRNEQGRANTERARTMEANESFIVALGVEGTDQRVIAALFGVTRQGIQERLSGLGLFPWSAAVAARRANTMALNRRRRAAA